MKKQYVIARYFEVGTWKQCANLQQRGMLINDVLNYKKKRPH